MYMCTSYVSIVFCVLLISFYLCTVTMVTGTLSSTEVSQSDCPCIINNTDVDCSKRSTKLVSIPSCIPANVTRLYLENNGIRTISRNTFINLTSVKFLRIDSNDISHIEDFAFAGMQDLSELYLYENKIITITSGTFMNLSNLQILSLWSNRISHIEDFAFAGLHSLTGLSISSNDISHIEDFAFAGMQDLSKLYLRNNSIRTISRNTFINLTSVKFLSISSNDISHIEDFAFAGMQDLSELYLYQNKIMTITSGTFMNLSNLQILSLWSNRISHIEDFAFAGLHNLTKLSLQGNNLTTINRGMFLDLTSVTFLNLGSSHISHIEDFVFSEMQVLSKLDLFKNNLTTITRGMFMNITSFTNLSLWSNRISHIEDFAFGGMQNLSVLDLDSNRLTSIRRGMFMNITNVKILDLHRNLISNIEDSVFAGMHHLITLDLRDNDNLQLSEILCALNHTKSFLLKEYFLSAIECRCQFLDFQEQKISACTKVHQDYMPTVHWTTPHPCNDLPDTDVLMIHCEERGVNLKLKPEIEITNTRPGGIAVDPFSRLVFYSEENRGYIALITMSSLNHATVIDSDLVKPGSIALDMWNGYMCWINNGKRKIECANYDGSDRKEVVKTGLHNPIGLVVDAMKNKIYWSDGNYLYRCNLGGGPVNYIASTSKPSYRGLTCLGSRLYVIHSDTGHDTTKSYVYQYELDGTKKKTVFEDSNLLYDIHIYSDTLFYLNGPNSCEGNNHGCSHICIPTKNNKSKCLCPDELSLSMDDETCVTKEYSKVPITAVLVGTVIALLVAVAIFVLIIKRKRLRFVQRNQEMEMNVKICSDEDKSRTSIDSNEYSEIHDRNMDVFEDLPTHSEGKEDSESADQYNVIDLSSISSSPVDSVSFHRKSGLDNDGYLIPTSAPNPTSQRNLDEQEKHPCETTSYLN